MCEKYRDREYNVLFKIVDILFEKTDALRSNNLLYMIMK